jgi:hypothetical protein
MRAADFVIVGVALFAGGFAAQRASEVVGELRGSRDKIDGSDLALNWAVILAGMILVAIGLVRIVTG